MNSGLFRHRVLIQTATETKSETGAISTTYSTLGSRWADVIPRGSREYERLHMRFAEMDAAYRLRGGRLAATLKHRLVHDSQTMEIIGIETEGNRTPAKAVNMTLICRGRR